MSLKKSQLLLPRSPGLKAGSQTHGDVLKLGMLVRACNPGRQREGYDLRLAKTLPLKNLKGGGLER